MLFEFLITAYLCPAADLALSECRPTFYEYATNVENPDPDQALGEAATRGLLMTADLYQRLVARQAAPAVVMDFALLGQSGDWRFADLTTPQPVC